MKYFVMILITILLLGCTSTSNMTNTTNSTTNSTMNLTNVTPSWPHYDGPGFGFNYPPDMNVTAQSNGPNGVVVAQHIVQGNPLETIVVLYINTNATYGSNKDNLYRADPTQASEGFMNQDLQNDETGFLTNATNIQNVSIFSIGRDSFVAETAFTFMTSLGTPYTGYAMDIYVPARSLVLKVRIIGVDPDTAKSIKDNLLLSFHPE